MNPNDFCYMRRGQQLSELTKEDFPLLQAINQRGKKSDRALLLLHGFTSTPAVYRLLIPQIKHYDALICPQLPGHADSIAAFAETKSSDWLSYIHQECEHLFKEFKQVDVLGLSLGGLIACKLSATFAFNHMFLLAPALKLQMDISKNLNLLRVLKTLGFVELRGRAGNLLSDIQAEISFRRISIAAIIELFNLIREHQWIKPRPPIDLFLGSHDIVVDSKYVEQMFSHLPDTSIHWLTNSAHVLPLDNDWEQIVQCINSRNSV